MRYQQPKLVLMLALISREITQRVKGRYCLKRQLTYQELLVKKKENKVSIQ